MPVWWAGPVSRRRARTGIGYRAAARVHGPARLVEAGATPRPTPRLAPATRATRSSNRVIHPPDVGHVAIARTPLTISPACRPVHSAAPPPLRLLQQDCAGQCMVQPGRSIAFGNDPKISRLGICPARHRPAVCRRTTGTRCQGSVPWKVVRAPARDAATRLARWSQGWTRRK